MYPGYTTSQEGYTMSTNMHRLQISLPDAQVHFLQERARQKKMSVAAIIRDLIEREAHASESPMTEDPIWEIVGIGRSGKALREVDETAYEADWYARPPQTGRAAVVAKSVSRRRKVAR
jgi:hypothetical protein